MGVTDDVRNTRNTIATGGQQLQRDQALRGELAQGNAGRYQQLGEEYYTPLLEGNGGYSQEESDRIMGADRLRDIQNGGDYSNYAYTPEQQQAMYGDPNSRYRYMDWDGAIQRQNDSTSRQRDALTGMDYRLNASVTPDLKLDSNYYRDTDAAVSGSDAKADAALNKDDMTMSQDFVKRYRMTPEQQQQIAEAGAIRTRAAASAGVANAEAAARASGTGALGMAALKSRARRLSDVDAADNMVGGRLAASDAAANREKTIEQTRLDAGQRYGALASAQAMAQGDRRLAMTQNREGLRLSTTRDIADRNSANAKTVGGAEIGIAADAGDRARATDEFYTRTGTDIATGIDRDYRQTAAQIANNSTQTARDINADRLGRATYADTNTTARAGTLADIRHNDTREARGWVTGQQALANSNAQNEYGRQVQTYGTQSGAANAADGNLIQADRTPRLWEKIAGLGIGAISSLGGGAGLKALGGG